MPITPRFLLSRRTTRPSTLPARISSDPEPPMGSILYSGAARPRRKKRFLTLACERRLFPSSLGFCVILRSATRARLGLFSSQACDNAVHAGQRSAAQSECVAPACGLECGRRFEASECRARKAQEYEGESRNPCISDRNHFFLPTSCDAATLRRRTGMRRDDDHKTALV